jgi:hypothetical protein
LVKVVQLELEIIIHGRWDRVGEPNKQCLLVKVLFVSGLRHLAEQRTEVEASRLGQSTVVSGTQEELGRVNHGRWDGNGVFTRNAFITTSEDFESSDAGLTLMVV